MNPLHRALLDLSEDLSWFVRARELEALCVEVDDITREPALAHVTIAEGHADNASPLFVLEDAHKASEPGWLARAERIGAIHEARRKAMASGGMNRPTGDPTGERDAHAGQ